MVRKNTRFLRRIRAVRPGRLFTAVLLEGYETLNHFQFWQKALVMAVSNRPLYEKRMASFAAVQTADTLLAGFSRLLLSVGHAVTKSKEERFCNHLLIASYCT